MSGGNDLIISLLQDISKKIERQSDKLDEFRRDLGKLEIEQEILEEKLSTLRKFLTYVGCGTAAALVSIASTTIKFLLVK